MEEKLVNRGSWHIAKKYDDGKEHCWIVLLADGQYKELYGTYQHCVDWMAERDNYNQDYRLVRWDN